MSNETHIWFLFSSSNYVWMVGASGNLPQMTIWFSRSKQTTPGFLFLFFPFLSLINTFFYLLSSYSLLLPHIGCMWRLWGGRRFLFSSSCTRVTSEMNETDCFLLYSEHHTHLNKEQPGKVAKDHPMLSTSKSNRSRMSKWDRNYVPTNSTSQRSLNYTSVAPRSRINYMIFMIETSKNQ